MNNKKSTKWGTKPYRLQVFLPENLKAALDKYANDKYSSSSRVVSAIVRRAVAEYLAKEGYPVRQGGDDEAIED